MAKRERFDQATAEWIDAHVGVQTTVCKCRRCGLYYKPELGHKCRKEEEDDDYVAHDCTTDDGFCHMGAKMDGGDTDG